MKTLKRVLLFLLTILIILIAGILIFNKPIQIWIDNYSADNLKQEIFSDSRHGNIDSLQSFLNFFNFDEYTKPEGDIVCSPLTTWSIQGDLNFEIIEEKLGFASQIDTGRDCDSAFFYVYRKEDLENNKVILWIPGLGVSDFAFKFIKKFFISGLNNGYTVIVYVPPFHLERKHPQKENGVGFFNSDLQHNLNIQLGIVGELRTVIQYLEKNKVKSISGWGGSMGASFLLLTTQFYNYEHLSLMIPVIDWKHTMFENEELKELVPNYQLNGIGKPLLSKVFSVMSPVKYKLNLPKDKVLIQVAEFDQLTNKKRILEFANENNIQNVKIYKRGHATVLLSIDLYKDYDDFLSELK